METTEYDWASMERFSVAAFGAKHRVSVLVLAADAGPGGLYGQRLADVLAQRDAGTAIEKFVRRQLRELESANLITPLDTPARGASKGPPGRPPRLLARTDDEFWHCLDQLATRFRRAPPRA